MADHAARNGQFKKKVVASSVVLAAGAALLSGGIYAGWTSEATVDQTVGAVDLTAGFVETNGNDHVFQAIQDAFPGDHWTRYATLHNGGSIDQEFAVEVQPTGGGLTDVTDGLKAAISTCTVSFSANGGCEVGDQTELEPGYTNGQGIWVPPVTEPNLDDDATVVYADGFISDAGRAGAEVDVPEGQQLFFKIVYKLNETASQEIYEGASDTVLVRATSLTAQRVGRDRSAG